VNHSGIGEFALRDNNWKLACVGPARNWPAARGKATVAKLYNLDDDITEEHDVASKHPEIVQRLTAKLRALIDDGRSRPGSPEQNDRKVRFDIVPTERWAPPLN
jgi:arylsulfatase A